MEDERECAISLHKKYDGMCEVEYTNLAFRFTETRICINFSNKMIKVCGPDCLENLRKSKSLSLHDPTATSIFCVARFRWPLAMPYLTYRKIREVCKILEEWFFTISETGVSTVRHTRRQGKNQVSEVTSVLREGKSVTVWERT